MLHALMLSKDFPAYLRKMKALVASRQRFVSDLTGGPCPGVSLWIETPEPGRLHAERLLQSGIRVTPGDIYGPEWAHHVRVSLLRPASARFEQAFRAVRRDVSGDGDTRLIDLF
jgi:aspartate/methionine/tyrosine aminotransferase